VRSQSAAGRKKSQRKRHDPAHRARRELSATHPVHVVMRATTVGRLRQGRIYRVTRRVLVRYLGRDDFRVVHLSIQANHIHLLVEAADRAALTRGMHSLSITLAKAINRDLGRLGEVFVHRYHDTQITTARQARNALAYVLNNWRKHREDLENPRAMAAKLDPYASGLSFTGWDSPPFVIPEGYEPLPVSAPATWLLRVGWGEFGPIGLFETSGPLR
jgi:REP element-mobilizing transposase RayT